MADTSNMRSSSRPPDPQKEFFVSVELYVSTKAATGLRKPPSAPARKKGDKRESMRPVFSSSEDNSKKLKEKSSWLSLIRTSTGVGTWRPATCRLSQESEGCLLNVYVDETILYQSVYVHLLNHTAIRYAHRSLFFRRDCIGIHCASGQRWSPAPSTEPLYLHFSNSEVANTWITLLRSHAVPEIYGRYFSPTDGGLYRMWRQVELTITQGRNVGQPKYLTEGAALADGSTPAAGMGESSPEADTSDLDVWCEIFVNEVLSGRTTVKKGTGSPDWHEGFTFSDLPPFENLEILLWRAKKLAKPVLLGSIQISLSDFRRGESVEGWFPVIFGDQAILSMHVADLRLKMKVDEEIILPLSAYSDLLETLSSRNCLDWMTDLESRLQLNTLSSPLMSIAVARNALLDHIFELADREVDGTPNSHNTLFRGNTVFTKTMEMCMTWYGRGFLEASIGPVIRRLYTGKIAIEIDPVKSGGKSPKDIERNVDQLVYWCQEIWSHIYGNRGECPSEMRRLFAHIRHLVEKRYQVKETAMTQEKGRELPWQSVSAFCFLRFFVPAILHPHLFGLCPGLPEAPVQRSLTLIAKVIQSLANLNAGVQREEFMRGVKDFLTSSLPAMIDYILVVSTPDHEQAPYAYSADQHDRLHVINSLRQRSPDMPLLHREAIPLLPHLLDIPRHLAIVTSAVIRHSRIYPRTKSKDPADAQLDVFCARCLEVEQRALHRVSHLAARSRPSSNRQASASAHSVRTLAASVSVPLVDSSGQVIPRVQPKRRTRKTSRPSTAPSTTDGSDRPRSRTTSSINSDISSHLSPIRNVHSTPIDQLTFDRSPNSPRGPGLPVSDPHSPSAESRTIYKVLSDESLHTRTVPQSPDAFDDRKKKKGLLRGILTRH